MLQVRFCAPSPNLSKLVRFYVQRKVQIGDRVVVHPVPARATPMIEFDLGDPVDVRYANHAVLLKAPKTVVVGLQTYRRVEMHLRGSLESFVIMFQPDGLHWLFSICTREVTDKDYDAQSVLGSSITQLRERLGECRSFGERVRVTDSFLLRQSLRSRPFGGISAAAEQVILASGRVNILALADTAGMSMRQFQRRFAEEVGMRPKLFARIARFEAALTDKARSTAKSWTDVAHEFGYYDQMHMVHDFAEFTGGTPTETLQELETVFVEQIRTLRTSGRKADTDPRLVL